MRSARSNNGNALTQSYHPMFDPTDMDRANLGKAGEITGGDAKPVSFSSLGGCDWMPS